MDESVKKPGLDIKDAIREYKDGQTLIIRSVDRGFKYEMWDVKYSSVTARVTCLTRPEGEVIEKYRHAYLDMKELMECYELLDVIKSDRNLPCSANKSEYPHKCSICGSPAYNGFINIDCSNPNCGSQNG